MHYFIKSSTDLIHRALFSFLEVGSLFFFGGGVACLIIEVHDSYILIFYFTTCLCDYTWYSFMKVIDWSVVQNLYNISQVRSYVLVHKYLPCQHVRCHEQRPWALHSHHKMDGRSLCIHHSLRKRIPANIQCILTPVLQQIKLPTHQIS